MNSDLKVLIVGCGSIGAMKPEIYDSPKTKSIITWAHACYEDQRVTSIGFVDKDQIKSRDAAKKWNGISYSNIEMGIEKLDPNIVIIATPTKNHFENVIDTAIDFKNLPQKRRVIVCEKPMCDNISNAKDVINRCETENIPLLVGYPRRYNKDIQDLTLQLNNKEYGEIFHCKVSYTRGLLRDGSHAIDLCNLFFGEFKEGYVLNSNKRINDYSIDDPTFAAYLSFKDCPHVFFCPVDGRKYDVFDIDIFTEYGRILLTNHSDRIKIWNTVPELIYGDYNTLHQYATIKDIHLNKTMSDELNNAINVLNGTQNPLCTGNDALEVHKVYQHIVEVGTCKYTVKEERKI